ncbi:hypothetical protein ACF1CY_002640 [Providencia rettgeri]
MSDSICEIVDIEQGTPEWHKWRRTGVTATCSPILLGAPGAMKTPYQLYLQYAGLLASEDLSAIKQVDAGNKLEALARSYCESELGQIWWCKSAERCEPRSLYVHQRELHAKRR